MMRRFSIWVQEFGAEHEVKLCEIDNDPEAIIAALRSKTLTVRTSHRRRKTTIQKFSSIRVVDHQTP